MIESQEARAVFNDLQLILMNDYTDGKRWNENHWNPSVKEDYYSSPEFDERNSSATCEWRVERHVTVQKGIDHILIISQRHTNLYLSIKFGIEIPICQN